MQWRNTQIGKEIDEVNNMPWITTESGKHINTDWFDKERQIAQNKAEADKLNGSNSNSVFTSGKNDPEITDNIRDFNIPQEVRDKLDTIEQMKSYSDFEKYFKENGIKLDTDLQSLKGEHKDEDIKAVKELLQKIAVANETYKAVFGKDALSELKRINLYDDKLDNTAAYHFNIGNEKDPFAGTIRFRDWNATGRHVFHELAHAVQNSLKAKGEDPISFANRIARFINIPKSAYTGGYGEENAERMAEALAHAFTRGNKKGQAFILEFKQWLKRSK